MNVGDFVRIEKYNFIGIIKSINKIKNTVVVEVNNLSINISLEKVSTVSQDIVNKIKRDTLKKTININASVDKSFGKFNSSIDLHGYFVEEALNYIDLWIDKAIIANQYDLTIIHGKGEGILRKAIRQYLKQSKYVVVVDNQDDYNADSITYIKLI